MGCNCGGAQRSSGVAAARVAKATTAAKRGPQSEGYAWTGPQKRAAQATAAKN